MRTLVRAAQDRVSVRAVTVGGLTAVGAYVALLLRLVDTTTYDVWGALVIAPVLVAVSVPVLSGEAARRGDRGLFWLLVAALLLKVAGAVARHYVAFDVYGVADATGYHDAGIRLSDQFRRGDFDLPDNVVPPVGTKFVDLLTGIVYTLIGSSRLGGFVFYSWMSFWGMFLLYRAFALALPEARPEGYARLLFFLPTMLFWPSGISKDAWMVLTLGISAYGAARLLTGRTWRGLAVAAVGLWGAAMVRPHVAGIAGVATAGAFLLRRPREELRQIAPLVKGVSLVAVALVAVLLVSRAESYLEESRVDTSGGVGSVLSETNRRTAQGGSEFKAPNVAESPHLFPLAALTVVFRPLPIEARSFQSLLAAAEGTFLLGLALIRWRRFPAAVRSARQRPYAAMAMAYLALIVVAFSGIANFGILVRQRSQVLPMFLVLLAGPPPAPPNRPGRGRGGRALRAPEEQLAPAPAGP